MKRKIINKVQIQNPIDMWTELWKWFLEENSQSFQKYSEFLKIYRKSCNYIIYNF